LIIFFLFWTQGALAWYIPWHTQQYEDILKVETRFFSSKESLHDEAGFSWEF
jgi:hypothetical protein